MHNDEDSKVVPNKCGVLYKRGMGIFVQNWKERYFEFNHDTKTLTYYVISNDSNKNKLRGEIVLDLTEARLLAPNMAEGRDFAFEITCHKSKNSIIRGDPRTLMLAAHDEAEALGWLQAFNDSIAMHMRKYKEARQQVIRSGYMYKKSPAILHPWQMRFFVLTQDGNVTYYETERDFSHQFLPRGRFSLKNVDRSKRFAELKNGVNLDIQMINGRCYALKCEDSYLAEQWLTTIQDYLGTLPSSN